MAICWFFFSFSSYHRLLAMSRWTTEWDGLSCWMFFDLIDADARALLAKTHSDTVRARIHMNTWYIAIKSADPIYMLRQWELYCSTAVMEYWTTGTLQPQLTSSMDRTCPHVCNFLHTFLYKGLHTVMHDIPVHHAWCMIIPHEIHLDLSNEDASGHTMHL